jgi:menaquinone-9 beta-reductase
MNAADYDLIIVGGGLAGASLATTMASQGKRILVLERERHFKDRVRGEGMPPWGVAEARNLGIDSVILHEGGQEIRWWEFTPVGAEPRPRDLAETTAHGTGYLTFSHPTMQRQLLDHAEASGSEVWRSATVNEVIPGQPPAVRVRREGEEQLLTARLVVGADGRSSRTRRWAGFTVRREPDRLVIASVLLQGEHLPKDAVRMVLNAPTGQAVMMIPIDAERVRPYLIYRKQGDRRHLSGPQRVNDFITAAIALGAPDIWFRDAAPAGPLAEFEGAAHWVDHPCRDGVVLIGDAAAASDPSFGAGLALTLRDVRVLRDQLLATDDWDAAAHAYAKEHDRYFGALHRLEEWFTDLLYEVGPEADARRAGAFAKMAEEPDRDLDLIGAGPDLPTDEMTRRRFFAED